MLWLWMAMLFSRGDLSALLNAASVIKNVQQSNARTMALALEHDLNGIVYVFNSFSAVQRDEVE